MEDLDHALDCLLDFIELFKEILHVRVRLEHIDPQVELFEEHIDVGDTLAELSLVVRRRLKFKLDVFHFFVEVVEGLLHSVLFLRDVRDVLDYAQFVLFIEAEGQDFEE